MPSTPSLLRRALLLSGLLVGSANAQEPASDASAEEAVPPRQVLSLAAIGGYDDPTRNVYTGLELQLHARNRSGFGVIGAVSGSWAFTEGTPLTKAELGLVHHIPAERAIVRVGLLAHTSLITVPYRVAVPIARKDDQRTGLVPLAQLLLEFEYGDDNPFVFGIRAGMGSALSNFRCADPNDLSDCAVWTETVIASASGKAFFKSGLYGELTLGHISKLGIGYHF